MKKQNEMAYMSYDKLWRSEFYNNVSAKDGVQDINFNQLKLKINDSYKKDEKRKTKFEASNPENVTNKGFSDTNLSKTECQISYIEKDYDELNLLGNQQSVEKILIQGAVKTTIQKRYDLGSFDNCPKTHRFLYDFLFAERGRPNLEEVNDVIQ